MSVGRLVHRSVIEWHITYLFGGSHKSPTIGHWSPIRHHPLQTGPLRTHHFVTTPTWLFPNGHTTLSLPPLDYSRTASPQPHHPTWLFLNGPTTSSPPPIDWSLITSSPFQPHAFNTLAFLLIHLFFSFLDFQNWEKRGYKFSMADDSIIEEVSYFIHHILVFFLLFENEWNMTYVFVPLILSFGFLFSWGLGLG